MRLFEMWLAHDVPTGVFLMLATHPALELQNDHRNRIHTLFEPGEKLTNDSVKRLSCDTSLPYTFCK